MKNRRTRRTGQVLILTAVVATLFGPLAIFAQPCSGPKYDANSPTAQYETPYNAPGASRTIILKDGKFVTAKGTEKQWIATLLSNTLIQPTPGVNLRVAEISGSNTGTRTTSYILVLGCEKGKLLRLFQFSDSRLEDVQVSDNTFSFTQELWRRNDSHCCASKRAIHTYVWAPHQNTFIPGRKPDFVPAKQ